MSKPLNQLAKPSTALLEHFRAVVRDAHFGNDPVPTVESVVEEIDQFDEAHWSDAEVARRKDLQVLVDAGEADIVISEYLVAANAEVMTEAKRLLGWVLGWCERGFRVAFGGHQFVAIAIDENVVERMGRFVGEQPNYSKRVENVDAGLVLRTEADPYDPIHSRCAVPEKAWEAAQRCATLIDYFANQKQRLVLEYDDENGEHETFGVTYSSKAEFLRDFEEALKGAYPNMDRFMLAGREWDSADFDNLGEYHLPTVFELIEWHNGFRGQDKAVSPGG